MSNEFAVKQQFHSFVGVSLDIGDRRTMEDEFAVQKAKKNGLSYYGVYDGHAGSLASAFIKDNLCKKFLEITGGNKNNKSKLESAMISAHHSVDKEYFTHEQEARKGGHSTYSGSTSISLVFNESEGWGFVANAGDCRAVLYHQGKIVSLSNDHRVNRSGEMNSEMDRVISLGGWMEDGLLCGQLEPTRGIGDHDFKSLKKTKFPGRTFSGDLVSATPECKWFSLTSDADDIIASTMCKNEISVCLAEHYSFMVIASDGLWDVVSNCDILQAVASRLETSTTLNGEIVQQATDELLRMTRVQGRKLKMSMDNTTVVLIAFAPCGDSGHYYRNDSSCLFCFEPPFTPHTESIINSKAASIASTKKNKMKRNQKRKKRQQAKKHKK